MATALGRVTDAFPDIATGFTQYVFKVLVSKLGTGVGLFSSVHADITLNDSRFHTAVEDAVLSDAISQGFLAPGDFIRIIGL